MEISRTLVHDLIVTCKTKAIKVEIFAYETQCNSVCPRPGESGHCESGSRNCKNSYDDNELRNVHWKLETRV